MNKETTRKVITVSFVVTAFVVALVVSVLMDTAAAASGLLAKWMAQDVVRHGLPVALGLITFVGLQFNKKVLVWADEVVLELSKVVWPTRRDTTAMTIVVCIMLIISSVVLGSLDFISTELVKLLLLTK